MNRPNRTAGLLAMVTALLSAAPLVGAAGFSPDRGAADWVRQVSGPDGKPRSCVTCHGEDPSRPGRHATTGKAIAPLAPSAQPDRFSDPDKVEKWFKRNCTWTWGRECTPQEKTDFLIYLRRL